MNKKTKIKYELAKMYEYVNTITDICKRYDNNYVEIACDPLPYNACLMMIVQLGERGVHIRETNREFYETCPLQLRDVINMRNRVTHGYSQINTKMFIDALRDDMPFFKEYIEQEVDKEILEDPYILYEIEYDEFIEDKELEQNNELEL